jgi:hypothetical protein
MAFFSEIKENLYALDSGRRALRKFGLLFLVVGALIAAWLLYLGNAAWPWAAAAGALFGLLGLFLPAALKYPYLAWMTLALVIGWFVSRLLLALLYYLLVTPLGVVLKMMGKDFMEDSFDESESYWHRRETDYDPEQSEKMY